MSDSDTDSVATWPPIVASITARAMVILAGVTKGGP